MHTRHVHLTPVLGGQRKRDHAHSILIICMCNIWVVGSVVCVCVWVFCVFQQNTIWTNNAAATVAALQCIETQQHNTPCCCTCSCERERRRPWLAWVAWVVTFHTCTGSIKYMGSARWLARTRVVDANRAGGYYTRQSQFIHHWLRIMSWHYWRSLCTPLAVAAPRPITGFLFMQNVVYACPCTRRRGRSHGKFAPSSTLTASIAIKFGFLYAKAFVITWICDRHIFRRARTTKHVYMGRSCHDFFIVCPISDLF